MPKGTILDRLAGAMKTLGKREGRALTPRQRVAAAQRWNSLADIGEDELFRLEKLSENASDRGPDFGRYLQADDDLRWMGVINGEGDVAANPFLSDNLDKYEEQSEFLDWCRYNRLEPNGRNLKTFRWEKYKELRVPQRERIYYNYDNRFLPGEKMWYERSDMPDYLPVGWYKE